MLMFWIFKACTSTFAYYKLYQRKLKVITRKKYTLNFLIRPLNFFGRTREDSIHFHGSPKKNPETVSKYEGHTSSAKLLSVSSGKAYSKQMCLYKPWKSKTLAFFDDKRSKSGPRNFFKDFGCIILFKTLTGLIRAINRTNSWLNQTCRGDKRCQWRKEDHDSSRGPPKKNAQMLKMNAVIYKAPLRQHNL